MKRLNVFLVLLILVLFGAVAFAATFKTNAVSYNKNLHQPRTNGEAAIMVGTYEIGAATDIANDNTIQMVPLPADVTVTDVILVADDIENGTTITLDVGDGNDPDAFIAASTIGQAGGLARSAAATAFPRYYSAADTIDVYIKSSAATPKTSGTFSLTVYYTGGSAQ